MNLILKASFPILGFAAAYFVTITNMRSGDAHDEKFQSVMLPKEIVEKFEQLAFTEYKPKEAVLKYVSPDVIEHDPSIPGGTKEDIIKHLERLDWSNGQGPTREIKKMLVQDDIVMVFHHLIREPGTLGIAAMDMFRVQDGLIVEHWSVLQNIPEDSPNPYGMF